MNTQPIFKKYWDEYEVKTGVKPVLTRQESAQFGGLVKRHYKKFHLSEEAFMAVVGRFFQDEYNAQKDWSWRYLLTDMVFQKYLDVVREEMKRQQRWEGQNTAPKTDIGLVNIKDLLSRRVDNSI